MKAPLLYSEINDLKTMSKPYFFVESTPPDGALINYWHSSSEEPICPSYASVGRWSAEYGVIVTLSLNIASIQGKRGYCWQLLERTLINARV